MLIETPSSQRSHTIAVIGLGYVGLPLAIEFGKTYTTIGFDVNSQKITDYRAGLDRTGEVERDLFNQARNLSFTGDPSRIALADIVIVAVPTPVDDAKLPDFRPLLGACKTVGENLKPGATVVFESTVYPGATEEICINALEAASAKKWKVDFFVGYSPERINPGDKSHSLRNVTKVVSADCTRTLDLVAQIYSAVVDAGVHKASSIRVAEAAKVIENTQRDLNIALMNELAIIFHRLGIDTAEVLEAAGTKWNFLKFKPGLVGGHCIGVDPYYLTHVAQALGHHPEVILAGRRTNDGMGRYVARQTLKFLVDCGFSLRDAQVNVLGLTFKENCADLRNSKVADLVAELAEFGVAVNVHEPRVTAEEARHEYGIGLTDWDELPTTNCLILAVAHDEFVRLDYRELLRSLAPGGCVVDVKSALDRDKVAALGFQVWRL